SRRGPSRPVACSFGGRKTFAHGLGQNRKSSLRVYVFRFAPESRHNATHSACSFRANSDIAVSFDYLAGAAKERNLEWSPTSFLPGVKAKLPEIPTAK